MEFTTIGAEVCHKVSSKGLGVNFLQEEQSKGDGTRVDMSSRTIEIWLEGITAPDFRSESLTNISEDRENVWISR
jgi:hypothetical protein